MAPIEKKVCGCWLV